MLLQEVKAEAFNLPPSDRLMLVTAIIESLQETAVSAGERSQAIQKMRGLLKTDRLAPTDAEVAAMLADREAVEPEPELTPEVLALVRSVMAAQKRQ
jgi:hypothetical protein